MGCLGQEINLIEKGEPTKSEMDTFIQNIPP